jgi:hypothetical protein
MLMPENSSAGFPRYASAFSDSVFILLDSRKTRAKFRIHGNIRFSLAARFGQPWIENSYSLRGMVYAVIDTILYTQMEGTAMRGNSIIVVATYLLAISLAAAVVSWAAGAAAAPKVPKGWRFTFPDGDPKAGKAVFISMKCYSCHAIDIPGEKFTSRSRGAGPELTGYSVLPKEYLAESIIKPHTFVAAPGYTVKEGRVAMGEYNHFLSIQELIDLVAFIKHGTKVQSK